MLEETIKRRMHAYTAGILFLENNASFQLHSRLTQEYLSKQCGFTKQWGRGGSDFSNQEGRKIFNVFLAVTNLVLMNCACCVHTDADQGSRFHVWT
jgi:hypothetical protein